MIASRGRIVLSGCWCSLSITHGFFNLIPGTGIGLPGDEHMIARKLSRRVTASRRRSSSKTLFAYASHWTVMPSSNDWRPRTRNMGATHGSSTASRRRLPPMTPPITLPLKRPRSRLSRSSLRPLREATLVQKRAQRRSL